MQIEKRYFDMRKAQATMSLTLTKWMHENDLTEAEYLDFLAAEMRTTLKFILRDEMEEREEKNA
jgi:hypothetical protein